MLGDDPPYLSVGTEVSAKYKGAFCEAKIRKVVRSVKCRVTYKQGLGTATVADDQIKGTLRVGASVEARHNDRKDFVEATITKIQDCSQYTVVFDDGDITTLRRTALCLKSGRHFAESETLDQLPLTHPEHFGNPVIGGRRGRRSRQTQEDSSDDDDDGPRGSNDSGSISGSKEGPETEPEIGRVVCVELGDKKKKDNWFPGLVVAPTAQDTVRIRVRDDYLVRSFKDARYYTVPKKEATEFTKDLVNKVENIALKVAVEKAVLFLEKNELPPHWDRDSLFGNSVSSGNSDSDGELDSDSSDDEPREEKDHFVAQLYKFMDDRGTPINNCPMIGNEDIDLYRLFRAVYKLGGYNRVTNQNQWKLITRRLNFTMQNSSSMHNLVKQAYKKFLHSFEDFYRKLGCTMVNHPRGSMRKQRPGRSLIRDKDRNTPVPIQDKSVVKMEKEDDEKDKKNSIVAEDEIKKEKREIKKEPAVKEEEVQAKVKRKEEPAEESASGQDSDVNIEGEEESSSSEKSQKSSARLTPSSVSGKSKAVTAAKSKEEAAKKKSIPEKKKPDVKKQDKKDNDKNKEDDIAKTRSKSKEDVAKGGKSGSSSDARETRTPSRESDKKVLTKQRRMTEDELKKRGRKKKEVEGEKTKVSEERSVEYAPSYKGPIEIGDRLKVYYGPTHESKVTYEAKVIDMEKDGAEAVYLVHYTGWNTRYDEWIKCSRIAQNFTQAQGRVKRAKATPRPQTPSTSSASAAKSSKSTTAPNAGTGATSSAGAQSRRRAQSDAPSISGISTLSSKDSRKEDREGTPATRSMTLSPLISRTKSPATTASSRTTRVTRNADSATTNDLNRRTRRTSGHADAMTVEESESEDTDSLDSDASAEPEMTEIQARLKASAVQERRRREARARAECRMKIEETSDGEVEKDVEPRRGRRLRKTIGKMQEIKSEPESDEEQPKGRDFDLNQIRSELKGFDKAVKLEIANVEQEPEPEEEEKEHSPTPIKQERIELESVGEKKTTPEPEKKREIPKVEMLNATPIKRESIKLEETHSESTEDIYEFKEPEPFEFEVRNKRDSGGSTGGSGSTEVKEKDKDKDKDKAKKRVFEEDLKSPKKRQKTFATGGTPVKVEPKTENSPTENLDGKKKSRKIFKKNEESEEVDTELENTVVSPRDISKFYPNNYSGVTAFKRKEAFNNSVRSIDDAVASNEIAGESPKKKQPKTFSGPAALKSNDAKTAELSVTESPDAKKKVRKILNKRGDDADDNDEGDESNKELGKFFPNYGGAKSASRKDAYANKPALGADDADENSLDSKEKLKRAAEEDTMKNQKKRQKVFGASTAKVEGNATEAPEVRKKPVRKAVTKKAEEAEDAYDSGDSNEMEDPPITRDHTKYFSHYSGPKAKAAAMANENENLQDRFTAPKTEIQAAESKKSSLLTTGASLSHDKDESKSKIGESGASTSTSTSSVDNKQSVSVMDKKRISEVILPTKADTKQEMKPLDFTPIVPHALPVPAPISARLPATASIEEKLSAAAVFRSKFKDTKKEDDSDVTPRKMFKDMGKKSETMSAKKIKEKEESKVKLEPEKKKQQPLSEPVIIKKDPLQEIEVRKDPLLEVVKKKEEELKAAVSASVAPAPKTYGSQKKEQTAKLEETWKKTAAASTVVSISVSNEAIACEIPNTDTGKQYSIVRKETIVSKIKSSIDRDSIDSTDSSDSERRLTIIDSEDFPEDKCNESSSDVKTKTPLTSSSSVTTSNQFNCVTQQEHASAIIVQNESGITSVAGSMLQPKSAKIEEDGENLNSLLCEEEIPGSPTPGVESLDHDRAAGSQSMAKTDIGSKMAVAFVAAQLPLSTVATSTPLSNCAMVATMSGGVAMPQSTSSLVAVSMSVQHTSNIQPIRQPLLQPQPPQQQQTQAQSQPQPPTQIQHQQQQQQHHQQQQQQKQPHHEHVAPMPVAVRRRESNDAAPVVDNTPPTTPDSILSGISNSPRDERTGGSTPSSSEDTNSKLNRDSSEAENESGGKSGPGFSEDDGSSLVNSELGGNVGANSCSSDRIPKPPAKRVISDDNSARKRKKRKDQEAVPISAQNNSSGKKSPRQSARNARHGAGSDSDDTSEGSNVYVNNSTSQTSNGTTASGTPTTAATNNLVTGLNHAVNSDSNSNRSSRLRYNFLVELDPNLDGNQRIAVLTNQITELRKAYSSVKAELATVERRRKKLKRRAREAQKAAKAESQQS